MKKLFAVFLFLVMFFFAPLVEANGWLSGYYNRIKIPIDASKVDAALSNFPVLVKLTSANFDFSKANSDGYDFRFTSDDGTTLLKYERERHDSANSLAEYWIKVPSVSASADTYIYLYYRAVDTADGADPENVWDSNHKAVLHLKDNTTSSVLDSTSNNNDGTKKGANEPIEATGQIYKGQDFDGTDDYIDCGDIAHGTNVITIEAWIKTPGHATVAKYILGKILEPYSTPHWEYVMYVNRKDHPTNANKLSCGLDSDNIVVSSNIVDDDNWHYVAMKYDGSNLKCKVDNDDWNSVERTGDMNVDDQPLYIGVNFYDSATTFIGLIDEVRISKNTRSDAWIKASYYSGAGSLLKSFVNESLYGNFFLMF